MLYVLVAAAIVCMFMPAILERGERKWREIRERMDLELDEYYYEVEHENLDISFEAWLRERDAPKLQHQDPPRTTPYR